MKRVILLATLLCSLLAPCQESLSIPVSMVQHLRLSAAQSFTFSSVSVREFVAFVEANGKVEYRMDLTLSPHLKMPNDTVLILHTHPLGADPQPSANDISTTIRLGIPDCVITAHQIFCVLANGKVVKAQ